MTQIHRMRSALLAAGIGIATMAPAMAANDIFLKIQGVTGEVQNGTYKGDIQLTAYSQEFTDPATISSLGGGGGGRGAGGNHTSCGAITITKVVDSTSPSFLQFVTMGQLINNATIYFVTPSGDALVAPYTIALMRLRVTSITQGDTAPNTTAGFGITETISMIAERFEFSFVKQNSNGTAGALEKYGFDCLTNRQIQF